jgi:hypothetical protein
VTTIKPGLSIGDSATIEGTLVYTAPAASELPKGVAASTDFNRRVVTTGDDETQQEDRPAAVKWLINAVKLFVALLVIGLVSLFVAPRAVDGALTVVRAGPLPSAGVGCLTIVIGIAAFLALIVATVLALIFVGVIQIGPLVLPILSASWVVGALLVPGLYLLAWVGRVIVALWIGRRIVGIASERAGGSRWLPMVLGVLIYALLWSIPYIGPFIDFLGVLFGLGGIVLWVRGLSRGMRQPTDRALATDPLPAA